MAYVNTIGAGRREFSGLSTITNYALFMGGVNATHESLKAYDPFVGGRARLFMVRKPIHLESILETRELDAFKHILEYGCIAISGLQDIDVETDSVSGGYNGLSFDIPKMAKDNTNSLAVTCYEFSGLPIRTTLHTWINSCVDTQTGLSTWYGLGGPTPHIQANQTAEFIYVVTDNTGKNLEYACLFANCFPKNVNTDFLNYNSGEHNLVTTQIEFTATKYESVQINYFAKVLLDRYRILSNSLNMHSGYAVSLDGKQIYDGNKEYASKRLGYNVQTGLMSDNEKDTKVDWSGEGYTYNPNAGGGDFIRQKPKA